MILFLPKQVVFTNDNNRNRYLSSIDVKTLLYLIEQLNMTDINIIKKMFNNPDNNSNGNSNDNSPKNIDSLLTNYNLIKPNIQDIQDTPDLDYN